MKDQRIDVSVVVPVYNEEEVIERFYKEASRVMQESHLFFEFVFVDDGSRDRSFVLLSQLQREDPAHVRVIKLARNFGHQLAISAGMNFARGQAVIVTDSDLQDPPELMLTFIKEWQAGGRIVYGYRTKREGETWFKKWTADVFYKLLRKLTSIDIPENAGDFYLLDRQVVDLLNGMRERHRFLRGLIVWVGFARKGFPYERQSRVAGRTKFGLWRMVKFSLDAATSFSFMPLRLIMMAGWVISALAFVGILISIYQKIFTNQTVVGWTSLMSAVLFIGGVQLISLGLMGEYIARIGDDVKRRPLYTVETVLG